jgi:superfamily II DNA or RNA helicase
MTFIDGGLPDDIREAIDEELSFEVQGHEWTDSWQNGSWDGKEYLLKRTSEGDWWFPVGLLDRVRSVLDTYGVDYDVEGVTRPGRGDLGLSWDFGGELREYQEDAVNRALRFGSGVVAMPTGSGKTVSALRLAYELDWPFLVTVDNREIADQWVERIESTLGVEPARYYAGDRENGDVMVALYQSVYMDGEVVDDARLDHPVWLADECHNVAASTFHRVAMSCPAPYRFGFSATPEREDGAELKVFGGIGPLIADLSVERMIEEGFLAEPEWDIIDAPHSGGYYQGWQDEYQEEIVKNERRNLMIAEKVNAVEKPCLVTVERINHGERLEAVIEAAAFVHGSRSDRDGVVRSFREGDLPVMVATRGIVGEGFDCPEIASFVVAGGMKSEVSMIQQVGRALRPETETATIVDFYDGGDQWVAGHSGDRLRTYQEYYGSDWGPL